MHRAARRRKTSLFAYASALFDGFWLGMLDRDSLARFDELHYETRRERAGGGAAYRYDEDQWNLRGLFGWEREVLALLERGYDAVGYELHPHLVRAGALLESRGHGNVFSSAAAARFRQRSDPATPSSSAGARTP